MAEKGAEEAKKEAIQRELQSRVVTYKALESNLGNFARQKDLLVSKLVEIQNTIASIEEMNKSSSEMLFSVGSATFAKGKPVDKNKFIIEIGAGVAVEKTVDEAKKILESRKKEIEDAINNTQSEMDKIVSAMQRLEDDARRILAGEMQEQQKFRVV